MIKKVIAAIILFGLLTTVIVQAMEREPKTGIQIGDKAPDFELKTLTGETVKLSDYKGKKVILNFWATWCPPCRAEMPDMQKFYEKMGTDEVILAVNLDPGADVQGFMTEMGATFPVLLDEEESVMKTYKILSIPTTFFIDSEGVIRQKYTGAMSLQMMKKSMNDLK
ncbi:TlpA family protein disulfide reductase [Bacillus aquiflavi]|uniref:TlpA family protein disulfide reductase n=1 Tax=Bacillus aquiflavi TaxID=2672567 RepID=A0A6B3W0A7_9BACI|nr:TlpA disulfide reductase family protein [Bacillus aquiflavi]MBA4538575.1 TlpA family protein disulfide reductase [Bacillus aquiflavi]NEY82938.1 TlpA family protein disulfide reductase [Bacillus aquiflavi]UAC49560.1 TlpA family protein disulfide reductase [Bacillus aquiflavi]